MNLLKHTSWSCLSQSCYLSELDGFQALSSWGMHSSMHIALAVEMCQRCCHLCDDLQNDSASQMTFAHVYANVPSSLLTNAFLGGERNIGGWWEVQVKDRTDFMKKKLSNHLRPCLLFHRHDMGSNEKLYWPLCTTCVFKPATGMPYTRGKEVVLSSQT